MQVIKKETVITEITLKMTIEELRHITVCVGCCYPESRTVGYRDLFPKAEPLSTSLALYRELLEVCKGEG